MFTAGEIGRIKQRIAAVTGIALPWEPQVRQGEGLSVSLTDGGAVIEASDRNALARGFFLLSRAVRESWKDTELHQERHFASVGAMVDVSRGAVLKAEAVMRYIDLLAALGMNLLMLYTEDTIEVPEYPCLGYLRGRYTAEELRRIDDYADEMGVELVPCIQTLAHMEQFLQWDGQRQLRDQPEVMLIGEEEVYRLIEAELRTLRGCLRSKRIHIGMDEAHGVGLGRYYEKHGATDRFALLGQHLSRVVELCRQHSFTPMMWSDMFFRLGSKENDYYDPKADIPQCVIDALPSVDMVYWDYYHQDEDFYYHMLEQHRRMGEDTVFAGGIWTWSGFLPQVRLTEATMLPALRACARLKVQTVLATQWGDDGAETNVFLAAGLLPIFSEACWQGAEHPREEDIKAGECLTGLPRSVLDAYGAFYPGADGRRTGKALVWCDILYPLLHLQGDALQAVTERAMAALEALRGYADRLECRYAALLYQLLIQKAELVGELRARYLGGDRAWLQQTVDERIPALLVQYDQLMACHRELWERDMKRFGWEVLSLRYGAVTGRLRDVQHELRRYLDGALDAVPELDAQPLDEHRWPSFHNCVTPAYGM